MSPPVLKAAGVSEKQKYRNRRKQETVICFVRRTEDNSAVGTTEIPA
jgi:hypothetical protein